MSLKLQGIIAVVVVLAIIAITRLIKKNKLELRHALIWYLVGILILVFDLFPGLLSWSTHLLGIETPVNMLFFLGLCFALIIIFILTMWISRTTERIKKLTQELALLEKKVKDMDEENK